VTETGPTRVLTGSEKDSLRERGYVVLSGLVPRERVDAALRAINASLGRGLRPEDVPRVRATSFCPELQKADVILDLFRKTPAASAAASLLGSEGLERVTTGQIALSFPSEKDTRSPHPHIDGLYTPDNGVPKGSVLSFTMLAGIVLSDVTTSDAGNLVAWPGSHRLLEAYFRERGPKSLLAGMPAIDLGKPEPVLARAGDVVLCHYQLAHAAGPNTSPHVRYAVYFRLKRSGHDRQKWECLTDVWREWPAIRAAGDGVSGP
jgi:ectoine hydroxylase-related dioxygenase (phytanoyl-CoA dioxygenase family)